MSEIDCGKGVKRAVGGKGEAKEPRNQALARPRICLLTNQYGAMGGIGKSAHRIATGLAKSNVDVTVLTPSKDAAAVSTEPVMVDGVPVYLVSEYLKPMQEFLEALDREQPFDLFHCMPLNVGSSCFEVAARGARPIVSSIRGIDGMHFSRRGILSLKRSRWITSVSRASLDRALTHADISGCSSFIPNGVDVNFYERWCPSRENLGIVGTVCTIRPKKNIPLLVHAYSRLPREIRRKLLVVGDCPDFNPVNQSVRRDIDVVISERGLSSEAEITGYVPHGEIGQYLGAFGIFVLSSDHEGLPNTILEAAAAGVPIVATCVDGVKDVLTNDHDALLVPPGDCEALTAAIYRVLSDATLASRLSDAARQTAFKYSLEAERQAYLSLYEQLILESRTMKHPRSAAFPNEFFIVEVRDASQATQLRSRLYLDQVRDPMQLTFKGANLEYQFKKLPYSPGTFPIPGVVVRGKGTISFGSTTIAILEHDITVNGVSLHPIEFAVSPSGTFRPGCFRWPEKRWF